jgi:GGDEF domain-containing protein
LSNTISLVQALPPLAFLVFGVAFATLAVAGVSRGSSGLFAIGYVLAAGVFALDAASAESDSFVDRIILNGLYTLIAALIAFAIFARYERKAPRALIVSIAVLTMALYGATRLVSDSMVLRVFIVNAGTGVLMLLCFPAMSGRLRGVVDHLMAIVFAIYTAQFFFRPLLTFLMHEGAANGVAEHVAYISGLQIVVGVFAILLGVLTWVSMLLAHREKTRRSPFSEQTSVLANFDVFVEAARRLFRSSDLLGETPTLIIADINGLGRIRESQGAEAAEGAVAALEALIRASAVDRRTFARMDAGVFAIILPFEGASEAMRVAEGLRAEFAKTGASASFGVATRQPHEDFADLLERADAALYLAKSIGGGQVICDTDAQVAGLREALNLLGRRRYAEAPRKVA